MIKAVIFDFDGTLVDTLPFYIKAYDQALKKIGFKFTDKKIVQICLGKKEDVICKFLKKPEKTEEFTQAYFQSVKKLFKKATLFEDTIETLNFIKDKKIKMIIITFAYRWYINQMLDQYKLRDYFDFIISTDDVVHAKPDPEAVLKATDKLKIKPKETIVVGDSKNDILMGKSAGSITVLLTKKEYNLFYNIDEIKKINPNHIIYKISELKKLI